MKQREIKFRVWDPKEKKMMVGNDFGPNQVEEGTPINLLISEWQKEGLIFMQYTGFKDAGGDELYDGDIIEDDSEWYKIEWSEEDGAWYAFGIRNNSGFVDMNLSEFAYGTTCWKQGNIYENPELIK